MSPKLFPLSFGFAPRLAALYAGLFILVGIQLPFFPLWLKAKGLDAQQFEDTGLLVQALKAGTIDAALGNQSVLGYAIKDDSNFKRVENYATGEKLGIAIKKGNSAMLGQVNTTLKRLTDDGSLKKFETTWFGEATK